VLEHGLSSEQVSWSPKAVEQIISDYTREAGVRDLERKVAAVCRKIARKTAEGDDARVAVSQRNLQRYLGPPRFQNETLSTEGEVGVANGLAWTEAGGEVLRLEATLARGKGFVLTGQLGDVMKESGQAAYSYARGALREMDLDDSALSSNEIHVHVPAGATPKDGPSAGVTMATALVSLATQIPVRGDVAMTGEVTLRGRVLPVGGVRDKALAALRQGVRRVILPQQNLRDVDEIPRELKRKLEFIPVTNMREVLDAALERRPTWRAPSRRQSVSAPSVPPTA
jgi:ATP-dependent Lon protease